MPADRAHTDPYETRFLPLYSSASGLLLVLIFPLPGIHSLSWFALVPLIISSVKAKPGQSFFHGYLCGVIWGLGTLYWTHIYHPAALPAIVLITAFYPGFFSFLVNRTTNRLGAGSLFFTVPLLWTSLEYLKSLGFLGFPWNSLGYAHFRNVPLIQVSMFTGVFGISFIVSAVNGAIAAAIEDRNEPKKRTIILLLGFLIPFSAFLFGQSALSREQDLEPATIKIAGIQGSFGRDISWSRDSGFIMSSLLELAIKAGRERPQLVILPETAVGEDIARIFEEGRHPKKIIKLMARTAGSRLVIGAPYSENGKVYNSAYLFSPEGEIAGRYDKIKLVPGGEYFPYLRDKPFFKRILSGAGNYTPGNDVAVFDLPGARFAVLICFEGIFGDLSRKFVLNGAEFLVNITNDVWSCSKTSHYQHASMSVFRAVENRVYLVRVGNTGISKVISPSGYIEKELDYFERGFFTARASGRKEAATFYTRNGDLFSRFILSAAMILLILTAGPAKKPCGGS